MGAAGNEAAVTIATAIGTLGVEASPKGVRRVRLPGNEWVAAREGPGPAAEIAARAAAQLAEYVDGDRQEFELELDWSGVDAEHNHVLEVLRELAPYGVTVTYGELGRQAGVGDPRDVGMLMGRNPLPLVVPCHRVVAADGLGGFGGGLALKRKLLELEGVLPPRLDLGEV